MRRAVGPFLALPLAVGLSFAAGCAKPPAGMKGDLTVDQVADGIKAGKAHLYDANGQDSYRKGHVPTATWVDVGDLDAVKDFGADKSAELVFYCANPH